MRVIDTKKITSSIITLIERASFEAPDEVLERFTSLRDAEEDETARATMEIILENAKIARRERLPLCQDCGSVVVFAEMGQDLRLEGAPFVEAVNEGIRKAYEMFYLRKSIVADPLRRENTGTNAPGFIHVDIIPGDVLTLTVMLKGGGSENMSSLKMFNPTASIDEIIDYIAAAVVDAGPNPCPPIFLSVGLGGTADAAMLNAKKAVLRGIGTRHPDPFYADLEDRIMERLNGSGVSGPGPLGFGGKATAAGVFVLTAPTHIASLPVALNMQCHSFRCEREAL